jgi:hypothetical protein
MRMRMMSEPSECKCEGQMLRMVSRMRWSHTNATRCELSMARPLTLRTQEMIMEIRKLG